MLTPPALVVTLAVTSYALWNGHNGTTVAGLALSTVLAFVTIVRARLALRRAERERGSVDLLLMDAVRVRDELRVANEALQRVNVRLRTLQVAVAQGFNLIDERTCGRLRELVEEAGDDLAALVDEAFGNEFEGWS